MIVNVLTPVIRPQNLPRIAASLTEAAGRAPGVELVWHLSFDPDREGCETWRNRMLARISDGWVWLLDDDTVAHPDVLARVSQHEEDAVAVVFAQTRPEGWHAGCADPARLRNGALRDQLAPDDCVFDTGMVIMRRSLLGLYQLRDDVRGSDGYLWDDVLKGADGVVFIDETLAFYNALRPGEWA